MPGVMVAISRLTVLLVASLSVFGSAVDMDARIKSLKSQIDVLEAGLTNYEVPESNWFHVKEQEITCKHDRDACNRFCNHYHDHDCVRSRATFS